MLNVLPRHLRQHSKHSSAPIAHETNEHISSKDLSNERNHQKAILADKYFLLEWTGGFTPQYGQCVEIGKTRIPE
jgi:hypothetical protein